MHSNKTQNSHQELLHQINSSNIRPTLLARLIKYLKWERVYNVAVGLFIFVCEGADRQGSRGKSKRQTAIIVYRDAPPTRALRERLSRELAAELVYKRVHDWSSQQASLGAILERYQRIVFVLEDLQALEQLNTWLPADLKKRAILLIRSSKTRSKGRQHGR